jgi:putative protease
MKVLAPINTYEEVEMLIGSGADELYCGIYPPEWENTYGEDIWLNRRSPRGGNIRDWIILKKLVHDASAAKAPVFLTLNAPYYSGQQVPLLCDIAKKAIYDIGIAGFIIADIGLMLTIRDMHLDVKLHISSLGECLNSETIRFYQDLGAARIIFPKSLNFAEIETIMKEIGASIETEAFVLNDGCVYEEGFCLTNHGFSGALCLAPWQYQICSLDESIPLSQEEEGLWKANTEAFREYTWYLNSCGNTLSSKGLPNGPCGLCAIPDLAEVGVNTVKIAGRQASPYRKLVSLKLVKSVANMVNAGKPKEEILDWIKGMRASPGQCDSTYMCYYR